MGRSVSQEINGGSAAVSHHVTAEEPSAWAMRSAVQSISPTVCLLALTLRPNHTETALEEAKKIEYIFKKNLKNVFNLKKKKKGFY